MPQETFLKKYTATGADGGKAAGKESESSCMITDIIGINVFFFFLVLLDTGWQDAKIDYFEVPMLIHSLIIMNCKAPSS